MIIPCHDIVWKNSFGRKSLPITFQIEPVVSVMIAVVYPKSKRRKERKCNFETSLNLVLHQSNYCKRIRTKWQAIMIGFKIRNVKIEYISTKLFQIHMIHISDLVCHMLENKSSFLNLIVTSDTYRLIEVLKGHEEFSCTQIIKKKLAYMLNFIVFLNFKERM